MDLQNLSESRPEPDYDIDLETYDWSARVLRRAKSLFGVNFELHGDRDLIRRGHIFVFNHFARFETFIPQFLFYEATRVYCVSVAAAEFFAEDNRLAAYLRQMGVIPNSYPRLLPWLAEQILRGRKVVIFPEGGMVKDRRVLTRRGEYGAYSRSEGERRKGHTGAAVVALCLDLFKAAVRRAAGENDRARLDAWAQGLRLDSRAALIAAAREPTLIVPANITFYPLRVDENFLVRTVDLLSQGLSRRHTEELVIESNLLLRATDMDIRLGHPVQPLACWNAGEDVVPRSLAARIDSLEQVFTLTRGVEQFGNGVILHCVDAVRDAYMVEMYQSATVNLVHLASTLILLCLERGLTDIGREYFHRALYLAVRKVQHLPGVRLHRGLQNPEEYCVVLDQAHRGLAEFFRMAEKCGLLESQGERLKFLPKLRAEYAIDEIRRENPVAVYANEARPVNGLVRAVGLALAEAGDLGAEKLSNLRFGDELLAWRWDTTAYRKPEHAAANALETVTHQAGPFLLRPRGGNGEGVLLIHELLACPAAMRGLAEQLADRGYLALGVRLEGHGTSPHDLDRTRWEDWLDSVRRAYAILAERVDRIHLVGVGAGGLLALRLAAESPARLAHLVAVSLPMNLGSANPILFLRRSTRHLLRWISQRPGQPFTEREPEFPHLSYRQVPLRAIRELHALADEVEKHLPAVECPAFLAQADADPVLAPDSTRQVYQALGTAQKVFLPLQGCSHNPIVGNCDGIWGKIIRFLREGVPAITSGETAVITQEAEK